MAAKRTITIDGITIPAGLFGKLVNRWCGGDWYKAGRALYKMRRANPQSPVRYLQSGAKAGWLWEATVREDQDPRPVREWIDQHVLRLRPVPRMQRSPSVSRAEPVEPMQISDIIATVLGDA